MKPLLLCILDGVGMRKEKYGNAFLQAKTPNFDYLWKHYPHSYLKASGEDVGLPMGQMGNSEVGHLNIGAGRIVYQPLVSINQKIKDGTFFQNETLLEVINHVKENHSRLQIFGLLSDGGIHSHIDHLLALLDLCKKEGVEEVYLHLFTDGRDTLTDSAPNYFKKLEQKIKEIGIGKISTISGRYYAMDRDNRWNRTQKAYNAIVYGEGEKFQTYNEVLEHNYKNDITDEFIVPAVLDSNGCVKEKDGLLVFNYRPDRLRELFTALSNPKFKEFPIKKLKNIKLSTMMAVSDEVISKPAFALETLENTLGEYLSDKGISQLRIAETEKYAHVTYFFDGGVEKKLKKCDRILIPSPMVTTYDLAPDMSAVSITDRLLAELDKDKYQVIILNFANGDMLGHTGNMDATISSLETMDTCLGRLYEKIKEKDGTLVVTADHGNCEIMLDKNGNMITSHTTSLVPFIVTKKGIKLEDGKLSDIAPTMLSLLEVPKPSQMTGKSLIGKKRKDKSFWFIIASFIFLLSFVGIYGYRFIHYYRIEHPHLNEEDHSLSGKILSGGFVNSGDGLYEEKDGYVYKGNVNNNYVYYSNRYFRIVKINADRSMVLITDDLETTMVWDPGDHDYKNSDIRNWLNDNGLEHTGIFYKSLSNPDNYIQPTEYCVDVVTDQNYLCEKTVSDKVGLLSIADYKNAKANYSYLNIGKYWWTSNASEDGIWYVFDEGGINSKSKEGNTYYSYGVRPVMTIKADVSYVSGDGTKENPYRFENDQVGIGSYILLNQNLWRIANIDDNAYQLLKETPIEVDGKEFAHLYSNVSSSYDVTSYTSLAYYLNTTYLNTFSNLDILLATNWSNGSYENYDYLEVNDQPVLTKVGLPSVGMFLPSINSNYVTMTKANENMIYSVTEYGSLYAEDILAEVPVRPMVAISKNTNFTNGDGTYQNPFVIE